MYSLLPSSTGLVSAPKSPQKSLKDEEVLCRCRGGVVGRKMAHCRNRLKGIEDLCVCGVDIFN